MRAPDAAHPARQVATSEGDTMVTTTRTGPAEGALGQQILTFSSPL
jgi:hypothetical protein